MTRDHIPQQVESIAEEFSPDVERIRWSFDEDWDGQESLFFRAMVTDEVTSDRERFHRIARSLSDTLTQIFSDFAPVYVNFRSVSECARTKEAEWE
jgi:hypothetical protein